MSRNQVSPSFSDIELDQVQQDQNGHHGRTDQLNEDKNSDPIQEDGTKPRDTFSEDIPGSKTSVQSDQFTKETSDIANTQQGDADDELLSEVSSRDNEIQEIEARALEESKSKDVIEVQENDDGKRSILTSASSNRSGAESRFVRDEKEGLIYEPGLPRVKDEGQIVYIPPEEDENTKHKDEAYYTESSSIGHPSTTNDKQPLVFSKSNTVFDGTAGGPTMPSLASNQVMPVDAGTYQMAEFRHQQDDLQRKNSYIIGADENTDGAGCCGWLLYIFSVLIIILTLPFSLIFTIKVVQEYERAVIFRLGRLPSGGAKGPGIFFIIPCIESYTKVDLRTVSFDVPPQEVLTKDSVTVSVDAVVYYRVSNPTVSVANVENAHHSTRLLAQTTLRNILGTKNMTEILSDRESISEMMQSTLDDATDRWGIKVERVEIKDVRLPVQLQRAMAAEAEAAREARAKVIAAEGEQKAARSLKEAADVMAQTGTALQLRYLQTLSSISAEKNSTIIFPLPMDLVSSFMNKK